MRRRYLVLLPATVILVISCHKEHNNPPANSSPFLTTVQVTGITDTSATSGGTFNAKASTMVVNFKGVQWDTSEQFPNNWTTSVGSGTGNFTSAFLGLFPGTQYYVRAFAGTDSFHFFYGDTVQFTTTYTPGKYLVSTLAGTGAAGAADGDASTATFSVPYGVAVDLSGNIYIADSKNNAVRRITPSGMVSAFGSLGFLPNDVITDAAGNVYVANENYEIIKITPSGQASVFAGSGLRGSADGTGTAASFYGPVTLAIDPAGDIYVGDIVAFRKITPAGVVSTLPDNFIKANSCFTIGVDNNFNLYESDGSTVGKIDSFGNVTVLLAAGTFGYISEIRLDAAGNLYLADAVDNKVRMLTPAGVASTIAGTGAAGAKDGNSAIATFHGPSGLAIDNSGNLIVADAGNNKIRKISPQ
jgi:hypothetical protein